MPSPSETARPAIDLRPISGDEPQANPVAHPYPTGLVAVVCCVCENECPHNVCIDPCAACSRPLCDYCSIGDLCPECVSSGESQQHQPQGDSREPGEGLAASGEGRKGAGDTSGPPTSGEPALPDRSDAWSRTYEIADRDDEIAERQMRRER